MKLAIKILIGLIAIPLLVILVALIILFTIDPNSFKPQVEKQLASFNIRADFTGDWEWKLYPRFQIDLGEFSVSTMEIGTKTVLPAVLQDQVLAKADRAYLSLDVLPLIRKNVHFNAFVLEGAELFYGIAKANDGKEITNLAPILEALENDAKSAPSGQASTQETMPENSTEFAIDTIQIIDSNVNYHNYVSDSKLKLNAANLTLNNVQLQGEQIDLVFAALLEADDMAPAFVRAELAATASQDFDEIKLTDVKASVHNQSRDSANALLIQADSVIKRDAAVGSTVIDTALELKGNSIDTLLSELGLMEQALPKPLSVSWVGDLAMNSDSQTSETALLFVGKQFSLNGASGGLNGGLRVAGNDPIKIETNLKLAKLQLSDFVDTSEDSKQTAAELDQTQQPLPLDLLDAIAAEIKLSVDELSYKEIQAKQLASKISVGNGRFSITDTSFNLADGKVLADLSGQQRNGQLAIEGLVNADSVESSSLLRMVSDVDMLAGSTFTQMKFSSIGSTTQALSDAIKLSGEVNAPQLIVKGVDLVNQFCGVLDIVDSVPKNSEDWKSLAMSQLSKRYPEAGATLGAEKPAGRSNDAAKSTNEQTEFKPINLSFSLDGAKAQLNKLDASLENIEAKASGRFDTKTLDFRVPFTLRVADFAKGIDRCVNIPEAVRKATIPLVCRGNIASIGPTSCVPDVTALRNSGRSYLDAVVDTKKAEIKAMADAKINAEKARLEAKLDKEKAELEAKRLEKEAELKAELDEKRERAEDKIKEKAKDKLKSLFGS